MIEAAIAIVGFTVGLIVGAVVEARPRFWKPSPVTLPESRIYWDSIRVNDDADTWTT